MSAVKIKIVFSSKPFIFSSFIFIFSFFKSKGNNFFSPVSISSLFSSDFENTVVFIE